MDSRAGSSVFLNCFILNCHSLWVKHMNDAQLVPTCLLSVNVLTKKWFPLYSFYIKHADCNPLHILRWYHYRVWRWNLPNNHAYQERDSVLVHLWRWSFFSLHWLGFGERNELRGDVFKFVRLLWEQWWAFVVCIGEDSPCWHFHCYRTYFFYIAIFIHCAIF